MLHSWMLRMRFWESTGGSALHLLPVTISGMDNTLMQSHFNCIPIKIPRGGYPHLGSCPDCSLHAEKVSGEMRIQFWFHAPRSWHGQSDCRMVPTSWPHLKKDCNTNRSWERADFQAFNKQSMKLFIIWVQLSVLKAWARHRGGWSRFSQNAHLIIAHHRQCIFCWLSRLTWVAWVYIAAYGKRTLSVTNLLWARQEVQLYAHELHV